MCRRRPGDRFVSPDENFRKVHSVSAKKGEEMNLNLDDLNLDELDVTSLRDTVALPETAASSSNNGSGTNTGSCVDPA